MSERPAIYSIGNVTYVSFRQAGLLIDGVSAKYSNSLTTDESTTLLRGSIDKLYVKSRDMNHFSDAHNLSLLILGYTKLLETAEGDDATVIILRLARCELMLAVLARNDANTATFEMAKESIIRFRQLIEYSGSQVLSYADGDQCSVMPFSSYINIAFAYWLIGEHMRAKDFLALADSRVNELFTDEQEGAKNLIRLNIAEARDLISS